MEGPDHAASLERVEFKALVSGIREIEEAPSDSVKRTISQGENDKPRKFSQKFSIHRLSERHRYRATAFKSAESRPGLICSEL